MNIRIFLLSLLLSLPFWWGVNIFGQNLEEIFFWQEIAENPQIFTAQMGLFPSVPSVEVKPLQNIEEIENFQTEAESVLSFLLESNSKEKILFEKESDKVLPIASLTKLMTAFIVLEYYPDFSQIVEISRQAVFQPGDFGNLKIGEKLTIENLLYIMLMESSNDAAFALSEQIEPEAFVDLMNIEAKYLGMENTNFVDPMGVSPENRSSAKDLAILTKKLLALQNSAEQNLGGLEKPLIWQITGLKEYELKTPDGVLHHTLQNTNELLGTMPEIIGGKTGYLPEAKGCLLTILEVPEGYIINVILGSEDRIREMQQLLNWLSESYQYIF